jgi:phosphoserine phosphatase
MEKIVVADWDNTMREGFTMGDWTSFLAKRGNFPETLARSIETDMEGYSRKAISYEELAQRVTSKYAEGLLGESQEVISRAAHEFVDADQQLFGFVRPLTDFLRACGVPLVLISGCPREPLVAYQQALGVSRIYALTLEVMNGVYTGKLHLNPTLGNEKSHIVEALVRDSEIILALGDSKADLPLLEAAPHTVIIDNPDLMPQGSRTVHRVSSRPNSRAVANLKNIVYKAAQGLLP